MLSFQQNLYTNNVRKGYSADKNFRFFAVLKYRACCHSTSALASFSSVPRMILYTAIRQNTVNKHRHHTARTSQLTANRNKRSMNFADRPHCRGIFHWDNLTRHFTASEMERWLTECQEIPTSGPLGTTMLRLVTLA